MTIHQTVCLILAWVSLTKTLTVSLLPCSTAMLFFHFRLQFLSFRSQLTLINHPCTIFHFVLQHVLRMYYYTLVSVTKICCTWFPKFSQMVTTSLYTQAKDGKVTYLLSLTLKNLLSLWYLCPLLLKFLLRLCCKLYLKICKSIGHHLKSIKYVTKFWL